MRLIDADKLRQYAIEITGKSEIAFDNCFPYWQFSKAIKSAEEVEAIPIEWIKNKKIEYEHDRYDYVRGCFDGFNDCIDYLINEWKEENEQNKESTSQAD